MSIFGRDGHKYAGRPTQPYNEPRAPQPRRSPSLFFSVAAILVWTVFAYAGYMALDILLGWLANAGGAVLATGKDVGTLVGAGKEVGVLVDGISNSGLLQQIVALARMLLAPAMLVVWFIGMVVLLVLPRIFGRVRGMMSSRRH